MQELGLGDEETYEQAKFYPPHKNSYGFLSFYWRKLYCVDEFLDIHGNYNSVDASALQVSFVKCDPNVSEIPCKSDEEIKQWMKRLFIVHLTNSIRFDQTGYKEETIAYESKFVWTPIRSTTTAELIFEIENKELRLQDS